jgi:hypothetical protein
MVTAGRELFKVPSVVSPVHSRQRHCMPAGRGAAVVALVADDTVGLTHIDALTHCHGHGRAHPIAETLLSHYFLFTNSDPQ